MPPLRRYTLAATAHHALLIALALLQIQSLHFLKGTHEVAVVILKDSDSVERAIADIDGAILGGCTVRARKHRSLESCGRDPTGGSTAGRLAGGVPY